MINVEIPTNVLIIISIIIFVLIVVCILYIIYKDRRQDDEEINDILDDLVKAKPRKEKIEKPKVENFSKESLINAKIEVPIGEIKEPVKGEEDDKINLEAMLTKMQKSLNSKQEVVENFETEQEEKAIISYQELLENMKNDEFQQDIEKYELQEEKTASEINKEKVIEFLKKEEPKIKKIDSFTENKKFKNTDFISPIFGKQNAKIEYPTIKSFKAPKHAKDDIDIMDEIEDIKETPLLDRVVENKTTLEQIINIEPLTDEVKKNTEFLNALKEFRSNL